MGRGVASLWTMSRIDPQPGRPSVKYECKELRRSANVQISSVLHLIEALRH